MEGSRDGEKTRANAGVQGEHGVVEMVREPGEVEDKGTAESPDSLVHEARAVETVVLGRVIPDGGRVLSGDRLVEKWSSRIREEPNSEE